MDLFVIGWDGASHRHLQEYNLPFWDSLNHTGKLLASKLFEKASYISSANAWTTMMTGASFEEHQILGFVYGKYTGHPTSGLIRKAASTTQLPTFLRRVLVSEILGRIATDGGRMSHDHIQSTDIPFKRVWEMTPGESLVFGLPLTYPTWDTDGILVPGIPSPTYTEASQPLTWPKEVQDKIFTDQFTGYYTDVESPVTDSSVSQKEFVNAHLDKSEDIIDTYIDLYRNEMDENATFGFLMLRLIDDVLHATDEENKIKETYRHLDKITSKLMNHIDPENVLIVSDHGMRPTSRFRIDADLRMDHDATEGIWAGTIDFELDRQINVTPKILDYFGMDTSTPVSKNIFESESPIDGDAVHERLKDLGYA